MAKFFFIFQKSDTGVVGVIEGVLKAAGRFGFILDKTVEAREESIFVFDKEVFIFIPQDGGDKVNIFLVFIFYVHRQKFLGLGLAGLTKVSDRTVLAGGVFLACRSSLQGPSSPD